MGEEMEVVANASEEVISSTEQPEKAAAQPAAEQPEAESAQPSQGEAGGEGSAAKDEVLEAPAGEASQEVEGGGDADADKDKDGEAAVGEGGAAGGEGEEKEEAGGGISFPLARVKRIMRKNPDKKKNFGQTSVHAVATIAEAFVGDLVRAAYAYTTERKRKTMSLLDLGDTIKNIPRFEFLDAPGILPDVTQAIKRARPAPAAAVPDPAQPQSAFSVQPAQGAAADGAGAAVGGAEGAAAADAGARVERAVERAVLPLESFRLLPKVDAVGDSAMGEAAQGSGQVGEGAAAASGGSQAPGGSQGEGAEALAPEVPV